MTSAAERLSEWAAQLEPTTSDLELAEVALLDTVAVTIAGAREPIASKLTTLPEVARWTTLGHILDFDDVHMESTSHISVVCLPVVLGAGGGVRAYLAGAGVMARLGRALGWSHYAAGWHTTTTTGAPAAAVAAAASMGLSLEQTATAIALSVPAAGGVQRSFGTDAKSLQVGFAAAAGLRAALLAADGATADPLAFDAWLRLMGGDPEAIDLTGPAVPGGLAVKPYPCCYALQRPISVVSDLAAGGMDVEDITRVVLRTPRSTTTPLIHHRPQTGLQAKFSLEYAAAAALLHDYPGLTAFSDPATQGAEAQRLVQLVETELIGDGEGLLAGEFEAEVHSSSGVVRRSGKFPPGAPERPLRREELLRKVTDCLAGSGIVPDGITWESAAGLLRQQIAD